MINLPSTTVRSKYLRTLPINRVYVDTKNGHKYQVVERRVGNVMLKASINYLDNEIEGIQLENITLDMLKADNIKKANINKSMKMKIYTLEDKVRRLLLSQHKSLFHRIKELLGDVDYYDSDDLIYCLHSGMVLPLKRKYYPSREQAQSSLSKKVDLIFNDPKTLRKVMEQQHDIQLELYTLLMSKGIEDDEEKVIML